MITLNSSDIDEDFIGIIALENENLPAKLSADEMQEQDFETVAHNLNDLRKMNGFE